MPKYYRLYGLTVESEVDLREAEEVFFVSEPDAVIRLGLPPEWVIREYKEDGKFSYLSEKCSWFRVYDEILIYVENGSNAIVWVLKEGMNREYLNTYILSGVFTFLLFQRGYTVIHGSAIEYNGNVFVVSGPSGTGKSTTAAELLKDDRFRFASDDLSAVKVIDGKCILFPGPPWQKLLPDAYSKQTDASDGEYVFLNECGGKYAKRLKEGYVNAPAEVKNIFYISKGERDTVEFKEVKGSEALTLLTHNLFRGEIISMMGIKPDKLLEYLSIVSKVRIFDVTRPIHKDTLDIIVNKIKDVVSA